MESTKEERVWHKGPPPHVGWWNAKTPYSDGRWWSWFDGKGWSVFVDSSESAYEADRYGNEKGMEYEPTTIEWSDYWPENARMPRVDPRGRE